MNYLAELHPIGNLSLKLLTIKTLALIALTSSDRGQTLHLMDVEKYTITEKGIDFVIYDRLKHTRKTLKPKVITCVTSDIDSLNVSDYVSAYMERTKPLRLEIVQKGDESPTQLFLSWAHSYRGAGLSHAYNHGASIG